MIIGIDVDNVVNDLCDAVLSVYNEDSGDNLSKEDITNYYIENFVKSEFKENFKLYFTNKKVWKRIKLIDNCQKYIYKLFQDGHTILFITATEPENLKKKANWITRNFPYINVRKSLFSCPIKQYMSGIDVLIDDCSANFGGQNYGIVLDYPWNRDLPENDALYRAKNWEEIYKIISDIDKINKKLDKNKIS